MIFLVLIFPRADLPRAAAFGSYCDGADLTCPSFFGVLS